MWLCVFVKAKNKLKLTALKLEKSVAFVKLEIDFFEHFGVLLGLNVVLQRFSPYKNFIEFYLNNVFEVRRVLKWLSVVFAAKECRLELRFLILTGGVIGLSSRIFSELKL